MSKARTLAGTVSDGAVLADGTVDAAEITNLVIPTSSTLTAVASGSLSDGSTVIVNTDGTVSVVAGVAQGAGTPTTFESASTGNISTTYDAASQRVVIAYVNTDNSSFGTAIVGTVSGTSISFGTAVVFESASTGNISTTYDAASQRVVIAYTDFGNSNFGTAIVGTVSGTSISFGTAVVFESANTTDISATYDSIVQRVVIAYRDNGNSNFGTAIVGTVSGTSISFGTAVVFESATTDSISAIYNSNAQRIVIAYRDLGNSLFGTAIVGTVSGTSISFGTAVVFSSVVTSVISATYDLSAQRVVIAYQNSSNSNFGTAIVGTVSGTSISFGTAVVFESAGTFNVSATYNAGTNNVVIAYRDNGNSNFGTAAIGTVSGTSISFGTVIVFEGEISNISTTYDAASQRVVIAYRNSSNSNFGTAAVFSDSSTNITAENFIGFSNAAYTNGQTATIQIVGAVDDAQSGLTPGQSYFVQNNGTLGLTPANPSVFAGTAVASNKIIVKG